jgi:hypothetical protein
VQLSILGVALPVWSTRNASATIDPSSARRTDGLPRKSVASQAERLPVKVVPRSRKRQKTAVKSAKLHFEKGRAKAEFFYLCEPDIAGSQLKCI